MSTLNIPDAITPHTIPPIRSGSLRRSKSSLLLPSSISNSSPLAPSSIAFILDFESKSNPTVWLTIIPPPACSLPAVPECNERCELLPKERKESALRMLAIMYDSGVNDMWPMKGHKEGRLTANRLRPPSRLDQNTVAVSSTVREMQTLGYLTSATASSIKER